MIKLQGFFIVATLALTLYTFIDCARRDETEIRKLPKWGWLLAIVLTGIIGPVAYLIIGRNPLNRAPKGDKPQKRILPPDDNPDFLKGL
jgi:amino acid permease